MNGVLLIDKPSGPTSHDVVARLRQVTRERSIGHAGTLDPRATGLLVMLLGKATRLAALLSGHDKTYDAVLRLGWSTTTDDAAGERLDGPGGPLPSEQELSEALAPFAGSFEQMPPQHSAKNVGGQRAYDLARRDQHVDLKAATVTVRSLNLIGREGDLVRLTMTVGAGFYVRSLARDLGARLGCGAHLHTLRRTHSGAFDVETATSLDEADQLGPLLEPRLISLADALPELPAVRITEAGLVRVRHGNPVGPQFVEGWAPAGSGLTKIRLLDESGALIALADLRGGLLHPSVVLG
ncbi:MAG TPA: tRNA pseudouridine(55) synthase TruB [Vicinamibacterales bacterium]|nr:tRNA pseudouridine(55) synthase TruB [Vicinamibacterales bacterium]